MFVLINAILFFITFLNNNIWYDETYTLALCEHSFSDILRITASDVHPPLYYFICKVAFSILGNAYGLIISRIISYLCFLIILIVTIRFLKAYVSEKSAMLFAIMFCSVPTVVKYELEGRMYMMAAMFVVISAVALFLCIKKITVKRVGVLLVCTICACYTHYYALLAVFVMYIVALIWCAVHKHEVQWLLATGVGVVIAYLPWLRVLFTQVQTVKKSYWIGRMGINDYIKLFLYPIQIEHKMIPSAVVAGLAFILVIICCVSYVSCSRKKQGSILWILTIPIGVLFIAVAVSYLVKPVLIPRYLFVVYWFVIVVMSIVASPKERIMRSIVLIALMIDVVNAPFLVKAEWEGESKEFAEYMDGLDGNILCDGGMDIGAMHYYFDGEYYVLAEKVGAFCDAYTPQMVKIDWSQIDEMKYLVTYNDYNFTLDQINMPVQLLDSFVIEGDCYKIYQLVNFEK